MGGLGWVSAANLRKLAPVAPGNGARDLRVQSIYGLHICVPNASLPLTSWGSWKARPGMTSVSPPSLSVLALLPPGASLHVPLAFSSVVEVRGSHGSGRKY